MEVLLPLLKRLGRNDEAATDPSLATGSVFSKLRGIGDDLDAVRAFVDTVEASLGTLDGKLGTNADAATDPSAATGTVFAKLRGIGADLDTVTGHVDTLEAQLGATNDGAQDAAGAAGSLHAKVRDLGASADRIEAFVDGLESILGTNADAATDPSAATGTVFAKLRGIGADLDTISAKTAALPAQPAGVGSPMALTAAGIGDVQSALTNQGLTTTRAALLEHAPVATAAAIDATKEFIQTPGNTVWASFKNVAGKGVVHRIFLQTESFGYNVRITIDGVVRYYFIAANAARFVWALSEKTATHAGEEHLMAASGHNALQSVTAPYLGWRFRTEFKVEAMNGASTGSSNGLYVRADIQKE